jgi:hypothetical protein
MLLVGVVTKYALNKNEAPEQYKYLRVILKNCCLLVMLKNKRAI